LRWAEVNFKRCDPGFNAAKNGLGDVCFINRENGALTLYQDLPAAFFKNGFNVGLNSIEENFRSHIHSILTKLLANFTTSHQLTLGKLKLANTLFIDFIGNDELFALPLKVLNFSLKSTAGLFKAANDVAVIFLLLTGNVLTELRFFHKPADVDGQHHCLRRRGDTYSKGKGCQQSQHRLFDKTHICLP